MTRGVESRPRALINGMCSWVSVLNQVACLREFRGSAHGGRIQPAWAERLSSYYAGPAPTRLRAGALLRRLRGLNAAARASISAGSRRYSRAAGSGCPYPAGRARSTRRCRSAPRTRAGCRGSCPQNGVAGRGIPAPSAGAHSIALGVGERMLRPDVYEHVAVAISLRPPFQPG